MRNLKHYKGTRQLNPTTTLTDHFVSHTNTNVQCVAPQYESIKMVGKAKSFVTLKKQVLCNQEKKYHKIFQHSHPVDLGWLLLATSMVSGMYLQE